MPGKGSNKRADPVSYSVFATVLVDTFGDRALAVAEEQVKHASRTDNDPAPFVSWTAIAEAVRKLASRPE